MLKLAPTEKTKFFHLEQLRVGQVLTFFCLVSDPGRSGPGGLLNFCLVFEPGRIGPGALLFFAWCLGPESQCAS